MATLKFGFSVDDNGAFTYHPASPGVPNWPYTHRDIVEFHCDKGPFTMRQRRTDAATSGLPDSFGGPVKATKDPASSKWVARTTISDGLTDAHRKQLFVSKGFISKYRYVFGVMNGADIAVDDNQAGIQTC
jgi:hypothetical protein